MEPLHQCFVDTVAEPVKLIDVFQTDLEEKSEEILGVNQMEFSTMEDIASYFSGTESQTYTDRYISICQHNSWRPLEITEPMMKALIQTCNIGPSIWDLASCFYDRVSDLENVFCVPLTESSTGNTTEISYTIRYPEFKSTMGTWVIRQTGVFHSLNRTTSQNMFILFNPTPNSQAHQIAESYLLSERRDFEQNPLWLHSQLFQTYLPAWRAYIASLELQFLPVANIAVATFVEELSVSDYRHLTSLASLESRFLQIISILTATQDILEGLSMLSAEQHDGVFPLEFADTTKYSVFQFKQHRQRCIAYSRSATYLHQRTVTTTQLLANMLSFHEQIGTKKQNDNMLQLNKSAIFITTITLLYLPPSYVATFFGMNFFDLDKENDQIASTSKIWIYIVCSGALTIITFLLYHLLLDRSLFGTLVRRLEYYVRNRANIRKREGRNTRAQTRALHV